ncbi:hypothetical protein Cgig2_027977 [Carnegiea gigantea]|uniref:Transcription factor n=1 Tax=Carnegiea gigantea TaxID=171969 RepID=A0A9Q1Q741_9CARY|nr:hypothetical protein Cgig2_027977 [Carnegiea gigantea]
MGENFVLKEEDNAMLEAVVGSEACNFLLSTACDDSLLEFNPPSEILNLQQGLCQIVDGSSWNYAIFWQIASSKSGRSVLMWADGHCRDPKVMAGERGDGGDGKLGEGSGESNNEVKKRVLEKLHACFGGSDQDNFAVTLDKYWLPLDSSLGPAKAYTSGRTIWASDANSCLGHYQYRAHLARSARFQTVVFVPMKIGVLELGSVRMVVEEQSLVQMVKRGV